MDKTKTDSATPPPRPKSSRLQRAFYFLSEPLFRAVFFVAIESFGLGILYWSGWLRPGMVLTSLPVVIFSYLSVTKGGCIPEPYAESLSMEGKTIIITGGNVGIGLASAIQCAKWKARVIIACRDVDKALAAMKTIREEAKLPSDSQSVSCIPLDLGDLVSVKAFADKIKEEKIQVDVLLNNAGIMACPYSKTVQGWETQFGVNVVGHFLLTELLLENIKQQKGRIVNVSSMGHAFIAGRPYPVVSVDEVRKLTPATYHPTIAYSFSKAGNILHTIDLARELDETTGGETTVYACHPGSVNTSLIRHTGVGLRSTFNLFGFLKFNKTPLQGAQTQLMLSAYPKAQLKSGGYYQDCSLHYPIAEVNDPELARKMVSSLRESLKEYM